MDSLLAGYETQLEILGTVLVALILGGLIGLEREEAEKPAGLRTHMLVAAAAALIVDLGDVMVVQFEARTLGSLVQADPLRLIEALAAGVSFLGAGTILRRRQGKSVEGLTTAASILFTAALGISVALSQYIVAVGSTVLALITLRLVRIFEERLNLDEKK